MIFGQLKKWSNVLVKKIEKIEVEANKCLKVRAVNSSCTSCLDICPVSGIDIIQNSLEINESCLDCGLCTAVCPTNALKWNHPPHIQLLNQLKRLSNSESEVYITCASMLKGTVKTNVVEVPCLGMLPGEFWINASLDVPNLNILYQASTCHFCQFSEGEKMFLDQKSEAEKLANSTFPICNSIKKSSDDGEIDHHRRKLLTSLLEEVKETNTITVKEVLEVDKTLSPFEKFDRYYQQQDEINKMVEAAEEIKNNVVDQFVNDNVIHTDKRALLYKAFEKEPELQNKMTIPLPEIKESCTRCGACAFLCPTDAIIMDNDNSMILVTNKCVSCGLCEEICYEKHVKLTPKKATVLKDKYLDLVQ